MRQEILRVKEGQKFGMRKSISHPETLTEVVVLPKCNTNKGQWYCVTHKIWFENQMQKDGHIFEGKHELAWVCFEHGVEVP